MIGHLNFKCPIDPVEVFRYLVQLMLDLLQLLLLMLGGFASQPPEDTIVHGIGPDLTNDRQDVMRVQSLLNQVPPPVGGPETKLAVDGIFGPFTEKAIARFRKIQFGQIQNTLLPTEPAFIRLCEYFDFASIEREGPSLAWGAVVTPTFKRRLLEVAADLEIDPNFLMAAIAFETGHTFSPAIENPTSHATGLIQFLPSTARGLGTTIEDLASMTNTQQLDWVLKHFQPFRGRCNTLADVYMAILWPAAVGEENSYVFFDQELQPRAYQGNRGLDQNRDGKVTKEEAAIRLSRD